MVDKNNKRRLQNLIGKLIDTKQDKPVYLAGKLGIYQNGKAVVKVPARPGYVYVRIGGSYSEIIEAINGVVSEYFDLKVIVTIPDSNPGVYIIVGRDLEQYSTFPGNTAYLPKHGPSHSFGAGTDPTFIYKKQMVQPLQAHPTNPRSDKLYVEADYYSWKGDIQYFVGGNTVSLLPAKPTTGLQARYVSIYLNGDTNQIGIVTGSLFNIFPLTVTGMVYYIPEILPNQGILLTAVLLTSGTSTIDWDDTKDIRSFLDGGGTFAIMHDLNPTGGYHTGTLPATYVSIVDTHDHYTGTNVEIALDEIWHFASGSIKTLQLPLMHQLDPANGFHTGSLPASFVSILDTNNHYTGTTVEQALDEIWYRTTGSSGAGAAIIHPLDPLGGSHTGTLRSSVVTIVDIADYYTGTVVEDALQEIGKNIKNFTQGHAHGITRLSIVSGTTNIPLFDFVDTLEIVSFQGFILDPIKYSLNTGSDYLVLDTATDTNGIITVNYVILGV